MFKKILTFIVMVSFASVAATTNFGSLRASATVPIVNELASIGAALGNDDSGYSSMSKDGRYVVFASLASNLVLGDTNGYQDIFLKDMVSGSLTRINVSSSGTQANRNSFEPKISSNGRYVVYSSEASTIVTPDSNNTTQDIYLYDVQTGLNERVNVSTAGNQTQTNAPSVHPDVSRDGRYVVFVTTAKNLDTGDTGNSYDLFVRDRMLGTTTRLNVDSSGNLANGNAFSPSISCDGAFVIFTSVANNLTPNDTNGFNDILLINRIGGQTIKNITEGGNQHSDYSEISCDGSTVAVYSPASNLVAGDTNNVPDVFAYDIADGTMTLASVSTASVQANGGSYRPSISSNGRCIVFQSLATNLASSNNVIEEIFIRNLADSTTELVSRRTGGYSVAPSHTPEISDNGEFVSYSTNDAMDVADTNNKLDIYRSETGATNCAF